LLNSDQCGVSIEKQLIVDADPSGFLPTDPTLALLARLKSKIVTAETLPPRHSKAAAVGRRARAADLAGRDRCLQPIY
jgi:hypothetical protein